MWRIKNLKVCEQAVNILYSKRLVMELDNISLQEIFFELGTSKRKNNLSGQLALDTGNVRTVHSSIFQGIKNCVSGHSVSWCKKSS